MGDGGEEEHDGESVTETIMPGEEDGNAEAAEEAEEEPGD